MLNRRSYLIPGIVLGTTHRTYRYTVPSFTNFLLGFYYKREIVLGWQLCVWWVMGLAGCERNAHIINTRIRAIRELWRRQRGRLVAVWPWTRHFPSLSLGFLLWKKGLIIFVCSGNVWKVLRQCVTPRSCFMVLVFSYGEVAFAMGSDKQRSREHDLSWDGLGDPEVCRFALAQGLLSFGGSLRFVEGNRRREDWTLVSGDVFLINHFMSGDQQL